ncbi:MAG: type II toxin-antitoxin system prevent-host-death family antitoxin [Deltaproteobacteria bacterium]|nr:type II toxin-antitoxin system prevent-host-death family antitoxin [Deltaproteobacteria bacterium]
MIGIVARVNIGELRDNASRYVRQAASGETIIVMNRNRAVAALGPLPTAGESRRLFGCLRGTGHVAGDLVAPATAPDEWFRT